MMAIVTLEDLDGSIEAVLFPQTLEKCRDVVEVDAVVRLRAKLEDSDRGKKLIVSEFEPFDGEAFSKPPEKLTIRTDAGVLVNGRREKLVRILQHYPGRDFVELQLLDEDGKHDRGPYAADGEPRGARLARRAYRALRRRLHRRELGEAESPCTLSLYCDRVPSRQTIAAETPTRGPVNTMRPVTARGFRDVLPAEAAEREVVARAVRRDLLGVGLRAGGDADRRGPGVAGGCGRHLDGIAFRLVDSDGRLLALRPDMTVPIARLVASRMSGDSGPLRFRYAAEVFREHESLRGQMRGSSASSASSSWARVALRRTPRSSRCMVEGSRPWAYATSPSGSAPSRSCTRWWPRQTRTPRGVALCWRPRTTATSWGSMSWLARRG